LEWALLVLDIDMDYREDSNTSSYDNTMDNGQLDTNTANTRTPKPLTVMCVDRRMPPWTEAVQSAMLHEWPHLENRFDYLEGSLEQLKAHPSCLLASVHACRSLSDMIVAMAASAITPVALVPCCHSRKKQALAGASEYAKEEYDVIINVAETVDLADRLDDAREAALSNAGFRVQTIFLPERFTLKNRLIMGMPQVDGRCNDVDRESDTSASVRAGQMPPLAQTGTAKEQFLGKFSIFCKDDSSSRSMVKELSGSVSAQRRKLSLH